MRMQELAATPPWEWPPDVSAAIMAVLEDRDALNSERLLAAEMAGDLIVMNDSLAEKLLSILGSPDEPKALRGSAAVSFGAALEEADIDGYDDDDPALTRPILDQAREALRASFQDQTFPKEVRRMALEASVRAHEPWHAQAVRAAYRHADPDWQLTSVFCMRFVPGFHAEIVEALGRNDLDIQYQAVVAAGEQGVPEAWSTVRRMVLIVASGESLLPDDPDAEQALLIAAIHAVAMIRPLEAPETLDGLIEWGDEVLAEAALEALEMVDGLLEEEEDAPTWH